jgi:hypothetical protein
MSKIGDTGHGQDVKEGNTSAKKENNITVVKLPPTITLESNTNTYATGYDYNNTRHSNNYKNPSPSLPPLDLYAPSYKSTRPNTQFNLKPFEDGIQEEADRDYGSATEDILDYITKNTNLREELVRRLVGSLSGSDIGSSAKFAKPTLKPPSVYSGEYIIAGNPSASEVNAEEWLEEMENYMRLNSYSIQTDKDKLDFARTYLTGAALAFFKVWRDYIPPIEGLEPLGKPMGFSTWEAFKVKLKNNFQPLNNPQYVRDQMELIQQGNKTVAQYVTAFRLLIIRVPKMTHDDKIWHFRKGLHPEIRNYVDDKILDLNKGPTLSLDDVIQIAIAKEAHLLHQLRNGAKDIHYNPLGIQSAKGNSGSGGNNYSHQGRGGYWGGFNRGHYNYQRAQFSSRGKGKGQLNNVNIDRSAQREQNSYAVLSNMEGGETEEQETKADQGEGEYDQAHLNAVTSNASSTSSASTSSASASFIPGPCWTCGKMGHISKECWNNSSNLGNNGGGNQRGRGRGGYRGWGRGRGNGRGRNQGKA